MISRRFEGLLVLIAAFLVVSGSTVGATNYQSGSLAYASSSANAYAGASASSSAISSSNAFAGSLAGLDPASFQLEGHKGIRSYDSAAYSGYNGPTNQEGHFGHPAGAAGPGNNRKPDTADSRRGNCAKCKWEDDDYWEKEEPEEPEEEEERNWEDDCDDQDDGQYHPEKSHHPHNGPQKIGGVPPTASPLAPLSRPYPAGSNKNYPSSYEPPSYPSVKGGPATGFKPAANQPPSQVNHPSSYGPPAYPYPNVKGGAAPPFKPAANRPPPQEHGPTQSTSSYPSNNPPGSYGPLAYPYPNVKGPDAPPLPPAANHPPLPPLGHSTPSTPVAPWNNGISSSTPGYTGSGYSRPKTPTGWNPLGLKPVLSNSAPTTTRPPVPAWPTATTPSFSNPWSQASTPAPVLNFASTPSQTQPSHWPAGQTPAPGIPGNGAATPQQHFGTPTTRGYNQYGTSPTMPNWTTRVSPTATISATTPRPYSNQPTVNSPCSGGGQDSPCGGTPTGPGKHGPPTKIGNNNPNVASGYPDPTGYKPSVGGSLPSCSDGPSAGAGGCIPGKQPQTPQAEGQWPKPIYGSPSPASPLHPSPPGAYPQYPGSGTPPREGTPSGKPNGFPGAGAPNPAYHTPINTNPSGFYPGTGAPVKGGIPPGKPSRVPDGAPGPSYPSPINSSPSVFYPATNNQASPSGTGHSPTAPDNKGYPNLPGHLPSAGGPTYYPTPSNNPYNPPEDNSKGPSPFPLPGNNNPEYPRPIPPSASGIAGSGPVPNGGAAPEYPSKGRSCACGGSTTTTASYPGMSGCSGCSGGCGGAGQQGCPQNAGPNKINKVPPSLDNNGLPINSLDNNGGVGGTNVNVQGQGAYNSNPFLTGKLPAPGLGGLGTDPSYSGSSATAPATIGKGNPFLEGGVQKPSSWGNPQPGYDSDKTISSPGIAAPYKPLGEGNPFFQKGSGSGAGAFGAGPTVDANPSGGPNFGPPRPSGNPAFGNQIPLGDNSFSGPGDQKKVPGGFPGSPSFGAGSFPEAPTKGRHLPKDPWNAPAGNLYPAGFGSGNSFAGAFSSASASSSNSAGGNPGAGGAGSLSFAGSGAAALAQPPFGQVNTAQDWSSQTANQSPPTNTATNANPWSSSGSSAYASASASSWAGAASGHY